MEQFAPGPLPYQCKECGWTFLSEHKLHRHIRVEHETKDTLVEYRCVPTQEHNSDGRNNKLNGKGHEPPVRLHIKLNHVNRDKSSKKTTGVAVAPREGKKKRGRSFCRKCDLYFFSKILFEQHLKAHIRKTGAVVRLTRLPIKAEVLRNASKNYLVSPKESRKQPSELQKSNAILSGSALLRSMLTNDGDIRQRVTFAESGVSPNVPRLTAIEPNHLVPQSPQSLCSSMSTDQASLEAAADSFDRSLMAELNSHIKSLAESIMRGPKESTDLEPRMPADSRPTNILQNALKAGSKNKLLQGESTLSTILRSPIPTTSGSASNRPVASPPKLISVPFPSTVAQSSNRVPNCSDSILPSVSLTITPSSSSTALRPPIDSRMRPSSQPSENGSRLCAILKSALVAPVPKSTQSLVPRPAQPITTIGVSDAASTERCNSVMIIEKDSNHGQLMTLPTNISSGCSTSLIESTTNSNPLAMLSQLSSTTTVTATHGTRQEVTDRPASVIVLDAPMAATREEHPNLSIQSVVSLAPDHAQELWGEAAGPHVLQDRRSQCCCGVCRNVRDGNLLAKSEIKLANGRIEYYCPICRRRFTHKISLFRHCRSFGHAFVCDMCSCGFLDQATFEAHKKSIHLVNMYSPLNATGMTTLPNGSASTLAPQNHGQRCPPTAMRPPPLISAPVSRATLSAGSAQVRAGNTAGLSAQQMTTRRRKQPLQPQLNPNPSPTLFHDRPVKNANVEDDDVIVVGVEQGRSRSSGTLPQPPPLKKRPPSNALGPPNNRSPGQPVLSGSLTRPSPVGANRMQKSPSPSSTVTLQRLSNCNSRTDITSQPSQLARILRNSEITLTPIDNNKPETATVQGKHPQQEMRSTPTSTSSPSVSSRAVQPPTSTRINSSVCPGRSGDQYRSPSVQTANLRAALSARQRIAFQVAQANKPMQVTRGPAFTGSTTYRVHPVNSQMGRRPETSLVQVQSPKDSNLSMPVWHHPVPSDSNRVVATHTVIPPVPTSQSGPNGGQQFGPRTAVTTVRPPPLVTTLPSCHQSHGPNKFPPSVSNSQGSPVFMLPPPPYPRPQTPLGQPPPPYRSSNQVPRVSWASQQQQLQQPNQSAVPPPPLTSQAESARNGSTPATVRCNLCEMTFLTQFAFQAHFNLMHSNPQRQVYTCGRCQRIYNKPALLKRHEMNCTEKVLCVKCNQLYYRNELLAHYSIDHFPGSRTTPSPVVDHTSLPAEPLAPEVSVDDGGAVGNCTLVEEGLNPVIIDDTADAVEIVPSPASVVPGDASSPCPETSAGILSCNDSSVAAFTVDSVNAPLEQSPFVWENSENSADSLSVVSSVLKELVEEVEREISKDIVNSESNEATCEDATSECQEIETDLEGKKVDADANVVGEPLPCDPGDAAAPATESRRTSEADTQSDDTLSIECAESLELHLSDILAEDKLNSTSWSHDDHLLTDDPESPTECIAADDERQKPISPLQTSPEADDLAEEPYKDVEPKLQDAINPLGVPEVCSGAEDDGSTALHTNCEDSEIEDRGPTVSEKESAVELDEEIRKDDVKLLSVQRKERACPICDQKFFSDRRFFRHIQLHQGVAIHRCSNCQAMFHSRKLLMSHFRTHLRSCCNPPKVAQKAKRQRLNDHGTGGADSDHSRLVVALLDLKQVEANKEFLRRMGVVGLMTLEDLQAYFAQKPPCSSSCVAAGGDGLRNVPMINLEDEQC